MKHRLPVANGAARANAALQRECARHCRLHTAREPGRERARLRLAAARGVNRPLCSSRHDPVSRSKAGLQISLPGQIDFEVVDALVLDLIREAST